MTAPAPIRHPAPAGELRLEWPGKCWVWFWSGYGMPPSAFRVAWSLAHSRNCYTNLSLPEFVRRLFIRARGPRPPWPEHIADSGKMVELPAASTKEQAMKREKYNLDRVFCSNQRDPGDETPNDDWVVTGGAAEPGALEPSMVWTSAVFPGSLRNDVCELVIAARQCLYEAASNENLRALDKALERFANVVGWDDAPEGED